ncbi:MAG: iron-sulfur cluster repair protein YtfE [Planctomycetota bacterium]
MNQHPAHVAPIDGTRTLAELAVSLPAASRVFHQHGLDFCCNGRRTVAEACRQKQLDGDVVLAELRAAVDADAGAAAFDPGAADARALIEHILATYHQPHRAELPRLLAMAQKVERVHGDKPECPRGLAALLQRIGDELELHMQKEEQVLFPALLAGDGRLMAPAMRAMELEHDDHGRNLEQLRELTADFTPPAIACNTWRALFLGLAELELQLMQHIHLENHVLFPRATN